MAPSGGCALLFFWRTDLRVGRKALVPLVIMGLLDGVALLAVISAATLDRPEYASVAASMFGLITILLAHLFLNERMKAPQWIGCIIAFTAIGYLSQ